jgi:hypothetical protein
MNRLALALIPLLLVSGCSKSSSRRGNASTAAGVSSSTPSSTTSGTTGATTSGAASGAAAVTTLAPIVNAFAATGLGGVYDVTGTDSVRGAYSGQVELRWEGQDYSFVREVEYSAFTYKGRPVSTVWTGRATDGPQSGVTLTLELQRMGFAAEFAGLPARTAVDGIPMRVSANFGATGSGGLQGDYQGQGAPFTDPSEAWSYSHPPYVDPIWTSERTRRASHSAPGRLTKLALFALFRSYHQTAWISPFTALPDFQAAVHHFTYDHTDFALHRARPDLLRLVDQLVDDVNLEEAIVKAGAFGQPLHVKAASADADVPARYLEPAGCLAELQPNGTYTDENDGCLWTGVYCYSQALRFLSTQEPAARDNMIRTARSLRTMMTISGQTDEFARTLRTVTGQPLGAKWRTGTGAYAGLEWKFGGNNDMWKGLLLGGLALLEGPGQSLRSDYGAVLRTMTQGHPVAQGTRRMGNALISWGTVAALTGDSGDRRRYRSKALNPFLSLYSVALGGGFNVKGITDWSGTHLNIVGLMFEARLAEHNNLAIAKPLTRLALKRAARSMKGTRRIMHNLVAHALAPSSSKPADWEDSIWALREMPQPRVHFGAGHGLRDDFVPSPWPNLPWKRDWTTNRGRAKGSVAPPLWELPLGSYSWKNNPFPSVFQGGIGRGNNSATDLLFAYWLARRHQMISASE